jgi:assimilatory nitrate reductase catalytic subunit
VLLPSLGWGEKDGTVTNSERRISRQRGFLPAPAQAKPDWWAMAKSLKQWVLVDLTINHAADFCEHARVIGV